MIKRIVSVSLALLAGVLVAIANPWPPTLIFPASNTINVGDSPPLKVRVSEPGNSNLTVRYFGRVALSPAPDFTMVVMPDTQCYSGEINGGKKEMMIAQTEWAISNRVSRNVAYVTQLGDISNNGDTPAYIQQWYNATNAMYRLEDTVRTELADGMAYGVAVGNHEQTPNGWATCGTQGTTKVGTTTNFNKYFGVSHFQGRGYYAGHYSTNNNNHFDLFSSGGLDFIALYFEYNTNPPAALLTWAKAVLATNASRRIIAVTHYMGTAATPGTLSAQGAAIYNALKTNTNLFLMLGGHTCGSNNMGEGSRTDTHNGNVVRTLISDYQCRTNGGNGLMRLMEFSPSNNVVVVQTYSPWTGEYETDEDSEFFFPYAMPPSLPSSESFVELHTESGVPSGSVANFVWPGLLPSRTYEWYVTVTDESNQTVTGSTWRFTTAPERGARHDVAAGLLEVAQVPGFSGADENTNCVVTRTFSVNDFQAATFDRADYTVQAGPDGTQNSSQGILLSCVTQNGRNNYGTNLFATSSIETNADGTYRIVTYSSPNTDGASGSGYGYEYNMNVAGAWFPYATWLGGFARNAAGADGGVWDLFTGSPGLALGTHLKAVTNGYAVVDLTGLGIDSRADGVLLVNHARDEGNFALSQVNTNDGTWNVFIKDNSAYDANEYEQDPLAFVFIPRSNTAVISGRFLANGTVDMYSGDAPLFTVTTNGAGRWGLKITGRTPAEGALVISAEGGVYYNVDNIVSCQVNTDGDGWEIQSRDTPSNALQTPGAAEPVVSFVFVPALRPGIAVTPEGTLLTVENGNTTTVKVMLDTPPTANVEVTIVSGNTNEGSVFPSGLTFTTNNWHVPQTITVTGVDDLVPDGDVPYNITLIASSSDPSYNTLQPVLVPVVNYDNETRLTLPSGEVSYGIDMPGIALDGQASIVDPNTPSYNDGMLTVTLTGGTADDRLEIRNIGTGVGQIGVADNAVSYGGTVIGSFAGGVGVTPLVVTFSSAATPDAVQALLRAITFRNVSNNPSLGVRLVGVSFQKADGGTVTASTSIHVGLVRVSDFQEGVDRGYGAYSGAADTELYLVSPTNAYPAGHSTTGVWMDVGTTSSHALLRFDNIIGAGLGQIPTNAEIVYAELILNLSNTGDGSPLYRMLIPWNAETETWNSIGGGVTPDGSRARTNYDSQLGVVDASGETGVGIVSLGVTADVQAWVSGGETNYGWVMPGWAPANSDGTSFSPCETATVGDRPRLRVRWVPAGTATVGFRQGVNGYTGARDTRIRENAPDADFSTVTSLFSDWAVSSASDNEHVLLRFDNIIGTGAGQIPPGARIESAVLDLASVVGNGMGDGGQFYALLQPWQDTNSTWNSWVNGIQADGVEAATTPTTVAGNSNCNPSVQGAFLSFDLTADVQAWTYGSSTNYGWVILPWTGGGDGWGFASAETATERNRPRLRVFFTTPSNAAISLLPPVWSSTQVQVRFASIVGTMCSVQRASALGGEWTTLGSALVGQDGTGTFTDTAPLPNAAYYRVKFP